MKPKINYSTLNPKKALELKKLPEKVGEFIQYWGFKAVQGRMWCYLFLMKEPLSSIQLSQLLEISPALVTQSVQVLLSYRVILEVEKGPNGVLRFQANPNVAEAVAGVLKGREALMLDKILDSQRALDQESEANTSIGDIKVDRKRVKQIGQWVSLANLFLKAGLGALARSENPFSSPRDFRSIIGLK